ncbi:hypothetical protein P171DRAFT_18062 [Karstenula rhodostoma CBS 690.94]|uniref:Uncharacterized protein n=1 Tax=Karstenula rhodostoma CBS 690.94 TaxID=1392251 RepID=A0A9P4UHD5_9PLEO|nr:hypothetical protein P171DRAFT_18062 [Karstenula rhodostoma CBS 690.94]
MDVRMAAVAWRVSEISYLKSIGDASTGGLFCDVFCTLSISSKPRVVSFVSTLRCHVISSSLPMFAYRSQIVPLFPDLKISMPHPHEVLHPSASSTHACSAVCHSYHRRRQLRSVHPSPSPHRKARVPYACMHARSSSIHPSILRPPSTVYDGTPARLTPRPQMDSAQSHLSLHFLKHTRTRAAPHWHVLVPDRSPPACITTTGDG